MFSLPKNLDYLLVFFSLALIPLQAHAHSFNLKTIKLGHPANGNLLQLDHHLAVSGHTSEGRWLSLIDLKEFQVTPVALPENAQFFAAATLAGHEGQQLVFLTDEGISRYDLNTRSITPVITSSSMHPVIDSKRFWQMEIAKDITGSGLSDFLIPDFTHYHLFVQNVEGGFTHYPLPIDSEANLWGTSPSFAQRKPYVFDITLDGKQDVVFVRDGQLVVFAQLEDGRFATTPRLIKPAPHISLDREANVRADEGRDFSQLVIYRVHDLQDLDGDGLTDLIIRREAFSSAVEQHYSYRIHYGQQSDAGLVFNAEPDTLINTQGIQFEAVFADINGDGRKDFYTPSATFGVGTIIRALMSGTANLDIQFYLMDENRHYANRPDFSQKASANVSISRGSVDLPLFQVASLNKDDHKQLIIGENQERLRIHLEGNRRLFATQGIRFSTPLPRDGSRARVMDINGDGLDDLVLPFDSQDSEETRNQIRVLLSQ